MFDVNTFTYKHTRNRKIPGLDENSVLFADDTTLIATNTKAAKALLHEIEFQSDYYGLNLNKSKCVYFAINKKNQIQFLDGTTMKNSEHVTYLGAKLTQHANMKDEISTRLTKANSVWHKLKTFWKKTNCTTGWKIQVYNSVIKSILLYGLETTHITKAQMDRLQTFHTKGLRHILCLKHTFIDRLNTNELIWRTANHRLKEENSESKDIETIEETLTKRRIKFLGHLLRAEGNDPIRTITFNSNSAQPNMPVKRRVGGPKKHWTWETLELAWKHLKNDNPTPFVKTKMQLDEILEAAKNRDI